MIRRLLLLGLLFAAPVWAQCDQIPSCVLAWSDEFDGDAVDSSKWSFMIGTGVEFGLPSGWGNNELQFYRPENATVADGHLTITAKQEAYGPSQYTSARLRSLGKGDWTYGRLEMRAKMPVGQGLWPAFWMLPSDSVYGTWAASGEIDIMEYIGSDPSRIFGTIHYGRQWPYNVYSSTNYFLPYGTFHDDFHEFALEWERGELRWYIDGQLFARRISWFSFGHPFPAPFDRDFHLLLNIAVGGNLPGNPNSTTTFPQEMVIDYVRVYQVPPTVEIVGPAPTDSYDAGDDITITANVDEPGMVQRVEFLQGKAVLGTVMAPPYEWTVPRVAEGCYTLRARAWDIDGSPMMSLPVDVTVGEGCPQAPYRMTPARVPGAVEAEDFDLGGRGVAYNDQNQNNNGGAYRPGDEVDIETCQDAGGGFNVGWSYPGEWLEYTIDADPGNYDIELRVASRSSGGTVRVEFDSFGVTEPFSFPATGDWQDWETVTLENVTLGGGIQTMRVWIDDGSFNLNRISVVLPPDADGDGVADREDSCPESDPMATVMIGSCDSETPNRTGVDGCSYVDQIEAIAYGAKNHGKFVSEVGKLMTDAMRAGEINGRQRGAVVSCAAREGAGSFVDSEMVEPELAVDKESAPVRRIP